MKKSMRSKKAASPFVATVILFALALLLGMFLVNFNTSIEEDIDACKDIYEVNLVSIGNSPRICYKNIDNDTFSLQFLTENKADKPVFGFHITVVGDSDDPIYIMRDYNASIQPYGTISKSYNLPTSIGNLTQFKLSVYRRLGADLILCQRKAIVISDIPDCDS